MKYKTIYADPPWPLKGGGKIKRGSDKHYPVMPIKEIIGMADEVKELADENSHLYLWAVNNFLPEAFEVMKAWGFRYITMITWGKDKFGIGHYFRGQTEQLLFGVRGKVPYRIINGKRQQGTTLVLAPRTKHSKKPFEMIRIIERVSYPPYLELFGREKWTGWSVMGNEVPDSSQTKIKGTYV